MKAPWSEGIWSIRLLFRRKRVHARTFLCPCVWASKVCSAHCSERPKAWCGGGGAHSSDRIRLDARIHACLYSHTCTQERALTLQTTLDQYLFLLFKPILASPELSPFLIVFVRWQKQDRIEVVFLAYHVIQLHPFWYRHWQTAFFGSSARAIEGMVFLFKLNFVA